MSIRSSKSSTKVIITLEIVGRGSYSIVVAAICKDT